MTNMVYNIHFADSTGVIAGYEVRNVYRRGETTRGKRKAVKYIIKVL